MIRATPYHHAVQTPVGSWAVVHRVPDYDRVVLRIDVDGFPDRAAAAEEAAWLNAERTRDQVRWANTAGLRGVRL